MAKGPIEVIAAMLGEENAPERRIAAAIVLAELGAKAPEVQKGLALMLASDSPPLQRPALAALAAIGSSRNVAAIMPLLASRDADVRRMATDAIVAVGEAVIELVQKRLPEAQGEERKALDAVLARFGGSKEAVTTLLGGLWSSDPEVARAVAYEVRPRIKDADAKTRKLWFAELIRILDRMRETPPPSPIAMATAVKILGYLEDTRAIEPLVTLAREPRSPFSVKQEALIALRYALADEERAPEVVELLVSSAESADRMLAQAALMSLAAVELPRSSAGRLARLAAHPDPERARIVIEKLARQDGAEATRALIDVVAHLDRRRGELASKALAERPDAVQHLVAKLIEELDADRAHVLRQTLKPQLKSVTPAQKRKIVEAALARLEAEGTAQALFDAARELAPGAVAEGLRALDKKLARSKNVALKKTVQALLSRSDAASPEERYRFASTLLQALQPEAALGRRDRASDEALGMLGALDAGGFDVGSALAKDKALTPEHLYLVGFHFIEDENPLGKTLLTHIVKTGGRTKLAKMAKNKLGLSAEA